MKRACALGVALLAHLGCSGERPRPANEGSSLLASIAHSPSYLTPAVWRYHPTRQAPMAATRPLPGNQVLSAGKRGERWVLNPEAHTLTAGASLAPEDLIAILDNGQGGYWFVGASGTSYEAQGPLGKFLRSSAPLEPLVRVSAAGHAIVGISANGALSRSSDGSASFANVGPANVTFADVALSREGLGLALAIPEALWVSSDEGARWHEFPAKTHGIFAVSRANNGKIQLDSVYGGYAFEAGPERLEPRATDAAEATPPSASPPRGPDANALADGRAVVIGSHYFEIAAPPARPSNYELTRGPLDGKLDSKPVPELDDCRSARIAAFDHYLELACFRGATDAGSSHVVFFRSESNGDTFTPESFSSFGNPNQFRFALGPNGTLIATGLCPAPGPGCSPSGVFVRREAPKNARVPKKPSATAPADKKPIFELFAAATPSLADSALGLVFSLDGRSAYAVGRRTKTSALAMFVSHDGGLGFEVRDLDLVRADSEDEDEYWEHSQSAVRLETFTAAEDGSLSLVIFDRHGRTLLVVDEQGRLVSGTKPPDDHAQLSGVGMRAFALNPGSRKAWESLDGGVSWQPLGRFPIALCNGDADCDVKVRCVPQGCVIGGEVSRIGWAGQSEADLDALPPSSREPAPLSERKLRAPIACSLDEGNWQVLPGVHLLPTAHDAALGKTAFVAVVSEPGAARAGTLHGMGGTRPHVDTVNLLSPIDAPGGYAFTVLDQIEGAAALRYRLPSEHDNHLKNIELAWDNALTGQVGHQKLADGGAFVSGDYGDPVAGFGSVRSANPALLSVAEGGLYVRLHQASGDAQETFYLDGRMSTRIPPVRWPLASHVSGRSEMVHIDNTDVPLMLFGHGTVIGRARREGADFSYEAEITSLVDPGSFNAMVGSNVAYLGNSSGLYVETRRGLSSRANAEFYPFRATGSVVGPPVAVPTQENLAERPNHCTPAQLTSSPRINALFLPGTRHPVVVSDPADAPHLFATSTGVLYGTPENACATAFEADEIGDASTARHERVLLLLDDLEHTWLFRLVPETHGDGGRVEYRNMKCHFDPDLEVPPDIFRAEGTLVPRGG